MNRISVLIPALNEEDSIGLVIGDIPKDLVEEIIVINNASTDNTHKVAEKAGTTVLFEGSRGYGSACLKGVEYLNLKPKTERPKIVVFLDGDYSDHPEELPDIIDPIVNENYDFVIGSRATGSREPGAMLPQALFGNWLATTLIRFIYSVKFTDLGPFRAIKYDKLVELGMTDKTFGWTVEMQIKAVKKGLKWKELPVSYRKRIGVSKITGTISGTIEAGYKILLTIFKYI